MRVLLSVLGSAPKFRTSGRNAMPGWFAAPQRWTEARMDIADCHTDWVEVFGPRIAKAACFLVLAAAVVGSAIEIVTRLGKRLNMNSARRSEKADSNSTERVSFRRIPLFTPVVNEHDD